MELFITAGGSFAKGKKKKKKGKHRMNNVLSSQPVTFMHRESRLTR